MNSLYFAQYLLNVGEISSEELPDILAESVAVEPEMALLALHEGMMSGEQIQALGASAQEFPEAAQRGKFLAASQIARLKTMAPDDSVRIAQILLHKHQYDYRQLGALLAASRQGKPLRDAVQRMQGELLSMEAERYYGFVKIFLRSVIRFMDTPAVVAREAPFFGGEQKTYVVSQRMVGDLNMVTGLLAREDVFLEMARRYSHEEIQAVDEMAIDSLGEFLNVVNGLFIVDMANQEMDIDLTMPRVEENVMPAGNQQMALDIYTSFGNFALIVAADEFVARAIN